MKTGAVVTVCALALGVFLGVVARRAHAAPAAGPSRAPAAAAAEAPSAGLAAARARLAELKSALPAARATVAPPTAAELRARFDTLLAAKDGEGLLRLIRDCQAAGPHAFPLALEIGLLIEKDTRHGPRTLGLHYHHSDRLYWGGLYPAASWAIAHPDGLTDEMMDYAIWTTGRQAESKNIEALRLLVAFADTAPAGDNRNRAASFLYNAPKEFEPELEAFIRRHLEEPALVDALVSSLIWHKDAGTDDLLEEASRIPRDEAGTLALLDNMGHRASDRTVTLLNGFASDPRPAVQEEVRFQLLRARPPFKGNFVEKCDPAGDAYAAGLRRGDIITTWNGMEFSTPEDLRKAQQATGFSNPPPFPIVVLRNGEKVTLTMTWGEYCNGASTRFTREEK